MSTPDPMNPGAMPPPAAAAPPAGDLAAPAAGTTETKLTNPLLIKVHDQTMSGARPQAQAALPGVIKAGQTVMYDEKMRDTTIEKIGNGDDPEQIGQGVADLLGMLQSKSKGTMPVEVATPAATLLLCEVLQFIEDGTGTPVTPDFLAECTQAMGAGILKMYGATPEMMQGLVDKAGKGQPGPAEPTPPGAPAPAAPPPGIIAGAQGGV